MLKNVTNSTRGRRALVRALTGAVGAAAVAGLASPAMAVGEGTAFVCRGGSIVAPVCPWYIGEGPVLDMYLADPVVTGKAAVIGVVSGFLPTVRFDGESPEQIDHIAFRGMDGRSRVIVGIVAGNYADGRSADGTPSEGELALQREANGVLATALANGDDDLTNPGSQGNLPPLGADTTQGLAPSARAIVASVAASISGSADSPQFETELNGFARALLVMADPDVAQLFADAYPDTDGDGQPDIVLPDVIVADIAEGGDVSGEGFIPRVADGIVHTYDVAILAPTGDDADAPVPQEMRQQFIFTRTMYAPGSGYNVIGVGGNDLPAGATNDNGSCTREYLGNWYESGRGTLSARNYAQFDPDNPTGFQEIPGARVGPAIVAPATKLRIPSPDGPNAYARDENICVLLPPPNAGPGEEPPEDMGKSTRYAAGYVAGAVALMQDAYKRLHAAQPAIFGHPRLPALVVRSLLLNSADRAVSVVGCWTNQSNFYQGNMPQMAPGFGNCQPFDSDTTQQALDTSVGAGLLDADALHENFQGRVEDDNNGALLQLATMDVRTTSRDRPLVRLPPSLGLTTPRGGGFFGNPTPPLGGANDPNLGGPSQPPVIGNPGVIPPNWPIRIIRPPSVSNFENPATIPINTAIPVQAIGWDIARLGLGHIDYVITSIIEAGDTFSTTMTFNRTQEIDWPNVGAGEVLPLDIRSVETQLELEDINLLLFTADSSGNPQSQVGRSATEWGTTEFVYLDAAVDQGPGGMPVTGRYVMRVEWEERKYDRFLTLFAADTEFGLAWRQEPVEQLGGSGLALSMPGDVNIDGAVDMADVNAVIGAFGEMNFTADANSDGIVNFQDLSLVLANFGRSVPSYASLD